MVDCVDNMNTTPLMHAPSPYPHTGLNTTNTDPNPDPNTDPNPDHNSDPDPNTDPNPDPNPNPGTHRTDRSYAKDFQAVVDCVDNMNTTPLMHASSFGFVDLVVLLLK